MAKLPDTQSETDNRQVPIRKVGVRALRYPVIIDGTPSVGEFSLSVYLPAAERGTHMSRFVLLVQEFHEKLSAKGLQTMVKRLAATLGSEEAEIRVRFPYFLQKSAPVSKTAGHVDHDVCWTARWSSQAGHQFQQQITVAIATLCPCSKAISDRGAHNQRGNLTLTVEAAKPLAIAKIIALGESAGSCELYSALKRPDEKFVTERAYDRPAFVEDVVRQATVSLRKLPGITGFRVVAENFESIHNHNAYAEVEEGTLAL